MPQAPIRLIAIDVDGTLLDSSHRVQAAVAMSLAGLHQCGIRIVLATARSPQLMEPVLTQLGFLPFLICFSGAWIGDPRSLQFGHFRKVKAGKMRKFSLV